MTSRAMQHVTGGARGATALIRWTVSVDDDVDASESESDAR